MDELKTLIYRVGAMLDDKAFDMAPEIFCADIVVETPGGQANGIDAAVAQARGNHEAYATQHLLTNVLVSADGDRGRGRAEVLASFAEPDDTRSLRATIGGRYEFGFVREAGEWRISELRMKPIWSKREAA